MYILFFGGFILFLDLINFAIDLNKKNRKRSHRNFFWCYLHVCDERNNFIKMNHYLCIGALFLSVFAQLLLLFPGMFHIIWLESITLFLICFLFYLAGYQVARSLWIHYKKSHNIIVRYLFFIVFLFIVLTIAIMEMYMLTQYLFIK